MSQEMPVHIDPRQTLTLHEHHTVRLHLPPLHMAGVKEPLRIHLDFDAETVWLLIERLQELHRQMRH